MSGPASTLIVPVESQVRELDAKLLLSCVAAERGFPVVIGSRAYIHYWMPFLPRGVYLAKSMRSLSDRMFGIVRGLGHEIAAWDEEGLVRFPSADYYRRRLSEKAFRQAAILFAWGPDDADLFAHFPDYHGAPIHVTGNPRVDLMRKELRPCFDRDVERLRDHFGGFILVNTNFSFVNNFVPSLNLIQPGANGVRRLGPNAIGMTPHFAEGMAAHKQVLFERFQEMIAAVSVAFPDQHIVVRPHPAERHDPWLAVARGRERVHVVTDGNVIPWLLAARVLLHNGCTTAVEAAVLDVPAIAYRPLRADEFDFPLPNSLSHQAGSLEDLTDLVRGVLDGRLGPLEEAVRRPILQRHLASLEGPLAAERMIDVLAHAGYGARRPPRPALGRFVGAWLDANVRTGKKLLNMRRRDHRNSAAHHAHRFPGITVAELRERIARFGRQLGRFDHLAVRQLAQHVFRIERAT